MKDRLQYIMAKSKGLPMSLNKEESKPKLTTQKTDS